MMNMDMRTYKNETNEHITLGHNFTTGSNPEPNELHRFLYVDVVGKGQNIYFGLPYAEAVKMRDHLNDLLGDTQTVLEAEFTAQPVVSDEAVEAISELAFRLDMFNANDLVDALNRHSEAIEGFNK